MPNFQTKDCLTKSDKLNGRKMSEFELKQEWDYRYEERLGILCGDKEPTVEEIAIAGAEADKAVADLRMTLVLEAE